jgi:hypothetical protein
MLLTLGVWVCALAASACTATVAFYANKIKHEEAVVLAAINGLGETHLMGIEILTYDLDKLKARVEALESWRDEP